MSRKFVARRVGVHRVIVEDLKLGEAARKTLRCRDCGVRGKRFNEYAEIECAGGGDGDAA